MGPHFPKVVKVVPVPEPVPVMWFIS
jgi:hypothetical protein